MKRAVTLMAVIAALALASQAQFRGMRAPAARPAVRGVPARAPIMRAPVVRAPIAPAPVVTRQNGIVINPGGINFGFHQPSMFQFFSPNSCDPFVFPCSSLVPPNGVFFNNGFFFRGRRFHRGFGFSPFFGGGFSPFFGYGYGAPIFADYSDLGDQYAQQQYAQPQQYPPQVEVVAVPMNALTGNAGTAGESAPAEQKQAAAAPAPPPQPERELPTAILIFRNQSRVEVRNYAIVGDTLYEFLPDGSRKKIALSEIDLPATQKINDERGVDFHVPPAKKGS